MRKVSLVTLGLLLAAGTALAAPAITELVVPRYLEAANSSTRLPAMFRVTLTGLTPSTTYRYWPGAVIATDAATANGAGNPLFLDDSYSFYTTSTGMATPGTTCPQLTTDATGSYTGWMGLVGTGNARFTAGNTIFLRVMLNDGAGGTSVATRLTTTSGTQTIALGSGSGDGTGVFQLAGFTPRDVVLLYDDTIGGGRPLATAVVQDDGATITSSVAFYAAIEGTAGAWATLVPNTLPTGLLRIEERAYADGSVVQSLIDLDGVWEPGAIGTVNPAGGATPIDLTGAQSEGVTPAARTTFGQLKARYR